ncbi:MAG: aminotransferase class IV [Bacteroidales bacterium]|nr:aminotransferase class IV [Bacteroidales bacterium]
MSLLFETIRVENGRPQNLLYHQTRMERSRHVLFGRAGQTVLEDLFDPAAIAGLGTLVRWRVTYEREVVSSEYLNYSLRPVRSLQLIRAGTIRYDHKFADRSDINRLFSERGSADDILIVRDGLITDTSYANIILKDGEKWYTPAEPLLRGTRRQQLLDSGVITERKIRPEELCHYTHFSLINAMIGPGDLEPVAVEHILNF